MATLTAPRSPDAELLDLNVLIRSTCDFMRYDIRLRGIDVEHFFLDRGLGVPHAARAQQHVDRNPNRVDEPA